MFKRFSNILFINFIKSKLNCKGYHTGKQLENDFYTSINRIWSNITDIKTANLTSLCVTHLYLTTNVCNMHSCEESEITSKLLDNNLNLGTIGSNLTDGKNAYKIYTFNNSNYDYYFIGDIHSDAMSLKQILKKIDFFNSIVKGDKLRLIFLGDYVDRGKSHLKTIELILLLKYLFPKNIFLLRGNHDGGVILKDEVRLCVGKNEDTTDDDYFLLYLYNLSKINPTFTTEVIKGYLKFFNSLSIVAFINQKNLNIMAVHGGIPRPGKDSANYYEHIKSISDLTNNELVDDLHKSIVHNLLWSDPCEELSYFRDDTARFTFTLNQFKQFKEHLGFDLLLRGHEAEIMGFKTYFNGELYTIFSSGNILENNININLETAYTDVSPRILKVDKNGFKFLMKLN